LGRTTSTPRNICRVTHFPDSNSLQTCLINSFLTRGGSSTVRFFPDKRPDGCPLFGSQVSTPTSPGESAGRPSFSTINPGQNVWTRSAFLVASPASPGNVSGETHFWGSNSGPKKLLEVRFLSRTIRIPKQNRRVPRNSRSCRVARKTAPLRRYSYGCFTFLAIYCD